MKNYQSPLLILKLCLLSFFLSSCSKDDKTLGDVKDKVIKISIQHEGDIQSYKGFLTVTGTLDSDQKRVSVSGVNWDEEVSSGEVTIYTKEFESVFEEISFRTDRPASGIQFGYSAWANDKAATEDNSFLTTEIKFYVDDKLVKTDTYTAGSDTTVDPYIGKLDAKDY